VVGGSQGRATSRPGNALVCQRLFGKAKEFIETEEDKNGSAEGGQVVVSRSQT